MLVAIQTRTAQIAQHFFERVYVAVAGNRGEEAEEVSQVSPGDQHSACLYGIPQVAWEQKSNLVQALRACLPAQEYQGGNDEKGEGDAKDGGVHLQTKNQSALQADRGAKDKSPEPARHPPPRAALPGSGAETEEDLVGLDDGMAVPNITLPLCRPVFSTNETATLLF